MNILLDLNHPAHVHLFRNAALTWIADGHNVVTLIRDKAIIKELLAAYELPYRIASRPRTSEIGMAYELFEHNLSVLRAVRKFRIEIMLGTSPSIAHVSRVTKAISLVFSEDDADYLGMFAKLAYPFADYIVIPSLLRDNKTRRHCCHNSFHELAYLHPNQFSPDPTVLEELGVKVGEDFFIVRLVAFKAHHDDGQSGLSVDMRNRLLSFLSARGKVFVTAEGNLPEQVARYALPISPHRVHDALYYASMLVSDSQTMTIEAAVLGTPAIRFNTFVGRCSVIEDIEKRYGLARGFRPGAEGEFFEVVEKTAKDDEAKVQSQTKSRQIIADKQDFNQWILKCVAEKWVAHFGGDT